jgi:hypothetical protein
LCTLWIVTSLLCSACGEELPDESLIISHRPLAIRTEVQSSLINTDEPDLQPRVEALPLDQVLLEPLIATPEGAIAAADLSATSDPVWIACDLVRGGGLFTCISAEMPLAVDDLPDCPVQAPEDLIGLEEIPETVSPCLIGREGTPLYQVPLNANTLLGGEIEVTMIASDPNGTSTDDCARPLLDGEHDLPNDCIFAVQRIGIGPIEELTLAASNFGLLPEGTEVPDLENIPDADRTPRIREFTYVLLDADGEEVGDRTELEMGDEIDLEAGDTIRMDVTSPKQDLQTYLVPINNGADFEERDEAYDGRWFRTWGKMLGSSSNDPKSYNEWTFEAGGQDESEDLPPDGRAHLFYVVRDGRQGVNWFHFAVNVSEAD